MAQACASGHVRAMSTPVVATDRHHVCQGWPAVDCAGGGLVAGTNAVFDPQRAGVFLPDLRPDAAGSGSH